MVRRDDLRDNRRDVYAIYVFCGDFNRRSGGNDCNLLRVPCDGSFMGKLLSQTISEARRGVSGDFSDERSIFARDGRQSY